LIRGAYFGARKYSASDIYVSSPPVVKQENLSFKSGLMKSKAFMA
jgi:hypothetical protein